MNLVNMLVSSSSLALGNRLMLAALIIASCVLLIIVSGHFSAFNAIIIRIRSSRLQTLTQMHLVIQFLVFLHLLEIILIGIVYHYSIRHFGMGEFSGAINENWGDALYFSFTTYTTVGYGDVVLNGPLNVVAAVEAVIGTVLMASSAAIVFIMLQRYLSDHSDSASNSDRT